MKIVLTMATVASMVSGFAAILLETCAKFIIGMSTFLSGVVRGLFAFAETQEAISNGK